MASGHGTEKFFSMGFEILGLEFKAKNARTTECWWREGCKMSAPSTLGLLVRMCS